MRKNSILNSLSNSRNLNPSELEEEKVREITQSFPLALEERKNSFETVLDARKGSLIAFRGSLARGPMRSKAMVSIISGCRNRNEHLKLTLPTWIGHEEVGEIIIVDWGSSVRVLDSIHGILKKHPALIRVVRVEEVTDWYLTLALNLAAQYARYPWLLKLDADVFLEKEFFKAHPREPFHLPKSTRVFYSGNWLLAGEENERHLNGVVFLTREDFSLAGGYNEFIRSYGWDDSDLYERLEKLGVKRLNIVTEFLKHIPHGDELRSSVKDLKLEITKNMFLSRKLPWSQEIEPTEYLTLICSAGYQNLVHVPLDLDRLLPEKELLEECEELALRHELQEVGLQWEITEGKSLSALREFYTQRWRRKFFIEPRNGLGNRIRALASAGVLSRELSYLLVVVWIPDSHFEVEFNELFETGEFLVLNQPPKGVKLQGEITAHSGTEAPRFPKEEEDVYITSACVISHPASNWFLESDWIREKLVPLPKLRERIEQQAREFCLPKVFHPDTGRFLGEHSQRAVGVHIRMGQDARIYSFEDSTDWEPSQRKALLYSRGASHYGYFLSEMRTRLEKNPGEMFFVCADSEEIYWIFEREFPNRVGKTIFWNKKSRFDRSLEQLEGAVLDIYLLACCHTLLGSPWSSFTELASRVGRNRVFISGKDFGRESFALLIHPDSLNLGDEIQSLAAERFLPRVDFLVDRDQQGEVLDLEGEKVAEEKLPRKIKLIQNGWFDGRITSFPPHPNLESCFVSFHLNESEGLLFKAEYQCLAEKLRREGRLLETPGVIDYLRSHAPVGTRDEHTLHLLQEKGVLAFHSSCLTLTLLPSLDQPRKRTEEILVVDAHIQEPRLWKTLVPQEVRERAIPLTHGLEKPLPFKEKQKLARELLSRYETAKLVITSRLHCALPCLAFHIPFLFLHSTPEQDPRTDATLRILLGPGDSLPLGWNWEEPRVDPSRYELAKFLAGKLTRFVKRFVDSLPLVESS